MFRAMALLVAVCYHRWLHGLCLMDIQRIFSVLCIGTVKFAEPPPSFSCWLFNDVILSLGTPVCRLTDPRSSFSKTCSGTCCDHLSTCNLINCTFMWSFSSVLSSRLQCVRLRTLRRPSPMWLPKKFCGSPPCPCFIWLVEDNGIQPILYSIVILS